MLIVAFTLRLSSNQQRMSWCHICVFYFKSVMCKNKEPEISGFILVHIWTLKGSVYGVKSNNKLSTVYLTLGKYLVGPSLCLSEGFTGTSVWCQTGPRCLNFPSQWWCFKVNSFVRNCSLHVKRQFTCRESNKCRQPEWILITLIPQRPEDVSYLPERGNKPWWSH